jgi:hypothetical protein
MIIVKQNKGADMDVHFYSEGTSIAGTLAEVPHPVAAALLITGSGRINRDSDARLGRRGPIVLRTGVTRQVAEALGAANLVTLRYDKRVAVLKASKSGVIRVGGVRANAKWWREFLDHDPVPDYARIASPVLAVTGGHDMQVSPEDVAAIGHLVKGPFDGHVLGDLSHLLRPDPDRKGPVGYRRAVRQPVSAEALALVTSWAAGILAA